jgi:hypothetical protein
MSMLTGMGDTPVNASVLPNNSLVATAGPTMSAAVGQANNVITQSQYWNLIIGLTQNPLGNANTSNLLTPSQVQQGVANAASQYAALPAAQQQQLLQPYLALWTFLPTYLANAPTVDQWDQQNNWGAGISYTAMGQTAQSWLQQFFSAIGVTPPATSNTGASSFSSLPSTPILIGIGVVGLALLMSMGGD